MEKDFEKKLEEDRKNVLNRIQENGRYMDFTNLMFSDPMTRLLKDILQTNRNLAVLNLDGTYVGMDGLGTFLAILMPIRTLVYLNLAKNGIDNRGAEALANYLRENNTLRTLILDDNSIGDYGLRLLANALERNRTLTKLSLINNDIQDNGVVALAHALRNNQTLARLYLDANNFGPAGQRAIIEGLTYHHIKYKGPGREEFETRQKQIKYRNAWDAANVPMMILNRKRNLKIPKEEGKIVLEFEDNPDAITAHLNQLVAIFPKEMHIAWARQIWKTRDDPAWLFNPADRRPLPPSPKMKRLKKAEACIGCPTRIAAFVEANNKSRGFCSSYCQFIHYHNLPDVRGMTPAQVKGVIGV